MQETANEQRNKVPGVPFVKGDPRINHNGRPKETEGQKIIKKARKELIEEYKDILTDSLHLIHPALIAKAVEGDVPAIKEIHDRVMDKAKQNTDITSKGESIVANINIIQPDGFKS